MVYAVGGRKYLFNLIDTPGHADFSYEVSRSLKAVQGALLVVDATVGVQAQTMSHYLRAKDAGVDCIIPVLNKVDLPTADVDGAIEQLEGQLGIDVLSESVHLVSAKTGMGVEGLLADIVKRIPAPRSDSKAPFRGLLIDSWFQSFRGVVCLVAILDGKIAIGDPIQSAATGKAYTIEEIGLLRPAQTPTKQLSCGQVGYVYMGIKSVSEAFIGDTFYHPSHPTAIVPGFKPIQPTVFAGFFPLSNDQFESLQTSIEKLLLNDPSVNVSKTSSALLGSGWRLGFLGTLHLDVFRQRLEQEYKVDAIVTAPNVNYIAVLKDGTELPVCSADDYPESTVKEFLEPIVKVNIVSPAEYTGSMMSLCNDHRGYDTEISYIGNRVRIQVFMPLSELIGKLNDKLLSLTAGYASMDYTDAGMAPVDLVKVCIRLNGQSVDALSSLQPSIKAPSFGRSWCKRLAEILPRQQFPIALQAVVGSKIIARETLSAVRKDVTAKCYGGDKTRQTKLLEQQKEGKEKMKRFGKVEVPHEAFLEIIKL